MTSRDRRPGSKDHMDIESLEQHNDRAIDALSDRLVLLKTATHGIRSEVESQHHVLDRMTDAMLGTRGMLGGAVDKFKVVMNNKQNKQMLTFIGGFAFVLLLLYFLFIK